MQLRKTIQVPKEETLVRVEKCEQVVTNHPTRRNGLRVEP